MEVYNSVGSKISIISLTMLIALYNELFAEKGWILQSSGITGDVPCLNSVYFIDENNGWITGSDANNKIGYILQTINGGKNWILREGVKGKWNYFQDIFFSDTLNGWIIGGNGEMFYTSNGGDKWTAQGDFNSQMNFNDIFFLTKNYGITVGVNYNTNMGIIIKTEDGGQTWETIAGNELKGNYLTSVYIINENTAWAAGYENVGEYWYGVILKTINKGNSWTIIESGIKSSFHGGGRLEDIYFIDEMHGWAVGYDGVIIHTNDGGHNWQMQNEVGNSFHSVYFIDQNIGWVVGDYGLIRKTTDGGANWIKEESNTGNCLESVFFVGEQSGWTVGSNWPEGGDAAILKYGELPSIIEDKYSCDVTYPLEYEIYPSMPNPFSNHTTIPYRLYNPGNVNLSLYNIVGKKVADLILCEQNTGDHYIIWDGRDDSGQSLPAGVYLIYFAWNKVHTIKKLIKLN